MWQLVSVMDLCPGQGVPHLSHSDCWSYVPATITQEEEEEGGKEYECM